MSMGGIRIPDEPWIEVVPRPDMGVIWICQRESRSKHDQIVTVKLSQVPALVNALVTVPMNSDEPST